jgi:hypothetical protein
MNFSANESQALLALAHTGRAPRGGITRRVFRIGLTLRTLALHGAQFALSHGNMRRPTLRLQLPR